ncbi:hypothetical protein [Mesorhizobium shangrilense]|uniref:Uncharacterized protein n=1 Tax=Mesorhizobium shangrilense TaxID=460060 RepID=A0ABV2DS80_9HYPH
MAAAYVTPRLFSSLKGLRSSGKDVRSQPVGICDRDKPVVTRVDVGAAANTFAVGLRRPMTFFYARDEQGSRGRMIGDVYFQAQYTA